MPNIGLTEILILLAIALMVVGPSKLPDLGRSLGRAIREFRNASATAQKELGLDEVAEDVRSLRTEVQKAKDTVNVRKQLGLDDIGPLDLEGDLEKGTSEKTVASNETEGASGKTTVAAEPAGSAEPAKTETGDSAAKAGAVAVAAEAATAATQVEPGAKAEEPKAAAKARKPKTAAKTRKPGTAAKADEPRATAKAREPKAGAKAKKAESSEEATGTDAASEAANVPDAQTAKTEAS